MKADSRNTQSPLGPVPQGWKLVSLKDISTKIGSGATPKGGDSVYLSERRHFALIRSQNVFDRYFQPEGLAFITDIHAQELDHVTVEPSDILLNITGDGITFARACVVPDSILPACVNQHVSIIRVDKSVADPRYVLSYLTHPAIKRYIESFNAGGSRRAITKGHIESFQLPLPPLADQRIIAQVLDILDEKIEANRRLTDTLEEMVRATFKSWFVDFDPVRAKAKSCQPRGVDVITAALFSRSFTRSPLGEIPKGWGLQAFPDAVDFLEGPGLRNWQYRNEGIRFLNIRCIEHGELVVERANCIGETEFREKYNHFALHKDDIVISTSGTLGRLAIVREDHLPLMLNTSIIKMRGRSPVSLTYVWAMLQSDYFQGEMLALASGSVQLNFGPMHLRRIKLLRPPDEILCRFEELFEPFIRRALNNRQMNRTLATTRDTLLPKLLSGDLNLKKFEQVVA